MSFIDAGFGRRGQRDGLRGRGRLRPELLPGPVRQPHPAVERRSADRRWPARSGGNVTDAFRTCVTTKQHAGWVESINAAADANGVSGTPTMFLDGNPVDLADADT